jgi:hypothetical protein
MLGVSPFCGGISESSTDTWFAIGVFSGVINNIRLGLLIVIWIDPQPRQFGFTTQSTGSFYRADH